MDGGADVPGGAEKQTGAQDDAPQDDDDEDAALMLDVAAEEALGAPNGVVAAPVGENLSDVDDDELDQYLCTEEEVKMKKQIWTISNKCVFFFCHALLPHSLIPRPSCTLGGVACHECFFCSVSYEAESKAKACEYNRGRT